MSAVGWAALAVASVSVEVLIYRSGWALPMMLLGGALGWVSFPRRSGLAVLAAGWVILGVAHTVGDGPLEMARGFADGFAGR